MIRVPKKVADALDYYKQNTPTQDSLKISLMAIPFLVPSNTPNDHSLVLREFALKQPGEYLQAITNGYVPIINTREELANMINDWLNKPYKDGEQKDIKQFANKIFDFIKQQT